MITLCVPSRNNLKYVKFAYNSIRKHLDPNIEVILLDDASNDGTWEWMESIAKTNPKTKIYRNNGPDRVGHTVLYDIGASMATNEMFGIFHADMVASPNYIKNMIKYMGPGKIVSATRVEPPLHPPGPEKYVIDLGMEPENFKEDQFINFVETEEKIKQGICTKGIFAPWIMYVKDFLAIGGHDKRVFAPMELEDSDLFNRFLLQGYTLIQSRDAFVYHMTCRGSRFKDGIKIVQEIPLSGGNVWRKAQDSQEYTKLRQEKFREWWRKWHMDVLHDENMLPIVYPRYDIGFIIHNCSLSLLQFIEPWADTIYVDINLDVIKQYIENEQKISKFDISKRVKNINDEKSNEILLEFDGTQFKQQHVDFIKQLPLVIRESAEVGIMEYDIFKFEIKSMFMYEKNLVHADSSWYLDKLKNV